MASKNKTALKVLLAIVCVIIAVASAAYITYSYQDGIPVLNNVLECACYIAWGMAILCIARIIFEKRNKSLLVGWLGLLISALVITAIVYFLNNFWHYIEFNSMFKWDDPVGYSSFLKKDILYTINHAWVRYPLVFVCSFLLGMALNIKDIFARRKSAD